MALVTVGIPFYNAAEYLEYAILSVLNQQFVDWQLILLNDGSSDNSLTIASSFKDERIQVLSDGENKGLVYRLNQLIQLCDTPYFARMDADDIMHPLRLKKQVEYLESHPRVDVLGAFAYSINTENQVMGLLTKKENPATIDDVLLNTSFIHPCVTARIEWYRESLYDAKYVRMEDKELWARKVSSSVFWNLTEPLLFYREAGLPYLSKYLKSAHGDRMLIRTLSLGFAKKTKYLVASYLKSLIYIAFTALSLQRVLIKRRSNPLSQEEQSKAMCDLKKAIRLK